MRIIATYEAPHQCKVQWRQLDNGQHVVQYGGSVQSFFKKDSVDAAESFSHCVHHAACCAGLLKED